ncbi:TetR/AcrR family transcriptional regulator [Nocardia sp. NPDC057227]|uniref:TetR/AcrR family transcriptional regulator n=1 Tax=Nocardia sp. NPDC057227 TaxID=3346056 RepID=UPI003631CED5
MGVRERVLAAALECFAEEGYERATIARIRELSGVSNGALFHHFPTKEAIAGALYVDSIASILQRYREILAAEPLTLDEAVSGVIRAQLSWVETNPTRARFLYAQGRLNPASDAGTRLREMNAEVGAAYREWLAPFIGSGAARELSMPVLVAVVTGPAHAIAQQWLAGQLAGSALSFAEELAAAAIASLSTEPAPPKQALRPVTARIRIELRDADGSVTGTATTTTVLDGTTT